MTINLSTLAAGPRIETALVTVSKLIKKLARPAAPPAPQREKRWMNG